MQIPNYSRTPAQAGEIYRTVELLVNVKTMNITLPNYFKLINFQRLSSKEQVLHLLFFVTVIAELRSDMTAKIISHRISDKKNNISPKKIAEILETDQYHFARSNEQDYRDRKNSEVAYRLTETARKELIKETNIRFAKVHFWSKPVILVPIIFSLAFTVFTLGLFIYHIATYQEVADISWEKFQKRTELEKVSSEKKAQYLLFFITEQIKFRSDMTPEVISNRLLDLGFGKIRSDDIKNYFENNSKTYVPAIRLGAYHLSASGIKDVKSKLALVPDKESGVFAFKWFLEYELPRLKLLLTAFMTSCLAVWSAGCIYGKNSILEEKLIE